MSTIPADMVGDRIRADGTYIGFNVRTRYFATLNYRHTGVDSPDPDKNLRIGSAGTMIFDSRLGFGCHLPKARDSVKRGAKSQRLDAYGRSKLRSRSTSELNLDGVR